MPLIRGIVIKGKSEGRKLGFPTANILLSTAIESGVYSGEVSLDRKYPAALFVGNEKKILEAYIFDWTGDLYGKEIEVEVKEKIRDVLPFKSDDQMKRYIEKDIQKIKEMQSK